MKICYLNRAKQVYFSRWYDFFVKRGHEVHVISGDVSHIDVDIEMPPGVKVHYLSEKKIVKNQMLNFGYNMIRLPIIMKELRDLIKQISPDIIHAHAITPNGFWGALSGFHPFIVTPTGSDAIVFTRKYPFYGLIAEHVFKSADIITSDSMVLNEAIFEFGGEPSKTYSIQNGVDLTLFNTRVDKSKIRAELNIGSAPVIFSSRGTKPIYNIDCVIKAIPMMLKVFPDAKFLFCYNGLQMVDKLKRMADRLGVAESTMFLGFVKYQDMPFYQAAADINISVPSTDSSPASVYESMACGVPVIVSDLQWTKHFIRNRGNALIVPPRDPEAIADSILEILQNKNLKNRLIEGGLSIVKQHIDYHKNMEMMERLMEKLVTQKG